LKWLAKVRPTEAFIGGRLLSEHIKRHCSHEVQHALLNQPDTEHFNPDGGRVGHFGEQGCSTLWNTEEVEEAIEAANGGAEAILGE
jgi:hypothetical protein